MRTQIDGATPQKWVLVTGGSRGIGNGLVRAFAAASYFVVFTYKNTSDAAGELEREVADAGGTANGYRLDHTNEAAVRLFAEAQLLERGVPHAIINTAGVTRDGLMMQMHSSQWREVIDTNLNAAFYITQPFVGAMAEQGDGVILQISSVAGIKGVVGQVNYSSTKAALSAFTRSLALELGRFNVRVNAIAPGYIVTAMTQGMPDAQRRALRNAIPLRRMGTVDDVSALAVFLLTSGASYITGQTFIIDGGLTA
jgi:3-oxoacyl-[acyl-carrier protein] reductase